MSENSNRCPQCGATLPGDAPLGLCPRCLLLGASVPTDAATGPHGTKIIPPAPQLDAVRAAFPQLEIIELIGRGGMGVVYKARQKTLDRIVALKLLAPERVTDAHFAERFTREAQALARLNHPNIVTIHDFGTATAPQLPSASSHLPFYFLLMEFVDGVNLRQAMKAGRFTPEQALAIVPPVCDALQFAHERGIVHRDIKPENLLLDKTGRVKIADFGIAKILGTDGISLSPALSPSEGERVPEGRERGIEPTLASAAGTPQYMAPEQREHHRTDHRADIYSLGVVLYELLTGELPGAKLQPPSSRVQIDVRLDEIVLRALETKPELRYQTAGEFRTQVETVASTPTSRPPGELEAPSFSGIKTADAYLSTPEWLASLRGKFWIYSGKGTLTLTRDQLTFTDTKTGATTTIPLAAIRNVSLGNYPWFAKPIPLHYISVIWEEAGRTRCHYFTPNRGWQLPVWSTNPIVLEWLQALRAAVTTAGFRTRVETVAPSPGSSRREEASFTEPKPDATPSALPPTLIVVIALYFVSGCLAAWDMAAAFSRDETRIELGVVGFPIAIGLIRRRWSWRMVALVVQAIGIVPGIIMVSSQLTHPGETRFQLLNMPMTLWQVPVWVNALVVMLNGWVIWVLTRPDVKGIFSRQRQPDRTGQQPAGGSRREETPSDVSADHHGASNASKAASGPFRLVVVGRIADRRVIIWPNVLAVFFLILGIGVAGATVASIFIPSSGLRMGLLAAALAFFVTAGGVWMGWKTDLSLLTDLTLPPSGSPRNDQAVPPHSEISVPKSAMDQSLLTSAATIRRLWHTPAFVLVLLYGALLVLLLSTVPDMPQRMAIHFNAEGHADNWAGRTTHALFIAGLPLFITALFAGLPALTTKFPKLLNIPRRDYWLAPERLRFTAALMLRWLLWLACLMTIFFGALHWIVLLANQAQPAKLSMSHLLPLVIGFLIACMIWTASLLMRFAETERYTASLLARLNRPIPHLWKKRTASVALAVLFALVLRTWFVGAYTIKTDALAPELPAGSMVLAWKLMRNFSPGDLIVYRIEEFNNVGRVTGTEPDAVRVNRNGTADFRVTRPVIAGKVISVLWRGTAGGTSLPPATKLETANRPSVTPPTRQSKEKNRDETEAATGASDDQANQPPLRQIHFKSLQYDGAGGSDSWIFLTTSTRMAPGESLTAYYEMPDGIMVDGIVETKIFRTQSTNWGYSRMHWLPGASIISQEQLGIAVGSLKEKIAFTPLQLQSGKPELLFSVTNVSGKAINAFVVFHKSNRAESPTDAPNHKRVTVKSVFEAGSTLNFEANEAPDANAYRVEATVNGAVEGGATTVLLSRPGNQRSQSFLWGFPNQFGPNAVLAAKAQVEAQAAHGGFDVTLGKPATVFSVTNSNGQVFTGVLEINANPSSSAIVVPLIPPDQSPPLQPNSVSIAFSPLIERTVQVIQAGTNQFLDLDTGELRTPPAKIAESLRDKAPDGYLAEEDARQFAAWLKESGADLMFNGRLQEIVGFDGFFWRANTADSDDREIWESITPEQTLYIAKTSTRPTLPGQTNAVNEAPPPGLPKTLRSAQVRNFPGAMFLTRAQSDNYYFLTREGGSGLLQIAGLIETPSAVTIRYKLVQEGAPKSASFTQPMSLQESKTTTDRTPTATNQIRVPAGFTNDYSHTVKVGSSSYSPITKAPSPNPVQIGLAHRGTYDAVDGSVRIALTNNWNHRILVWWVRTQVLSRDPVTGEDEWTTVAEDYPRGNKSAHVLSGESDVFWATPPSSDKPWRVSILYDREEANPPVQTGTVKQFHVYGTFEVNTAAMND